MTPTAQCLKHVSLLITELPQWVLPGLWVSLGLGVSPNLGPREVRLAGQPVPYGISVGYRKRLEFVGQAPLAVAILGEMLLPAAHDALAHALGDIGIVLQIPPFIDRHRKRPPALEIAVVHECCFADATVPLVTAWAMS